MLVRSRISPSSTSTPRPGATRRDRCAHHLYPSYGSVIIQIPGCGKASGACSCYVLGMTWPGGPGELPAFVGGGHCVQRVFPQVDLAEEFGLDLSNALGSESDS